MNSVCRQARHSCLGNAVRSGRFVIGQILMFFRGFRGPRHAALDAASRPRSGRFVIGQLISCYFVAKPIPQN